MKLSPSSQRLFRVALLGTMTTPLVLVLVTLARHPASFAKARILLWLGAYATFSLVFWLTARQDEKLSQATGQTSGTMPANRPPSAPADGAIPAGEGFLF